MSNQKPITHFIAGIILAAVQIILTLVSMSTGAKQGGASGWISWFLLILGLVLFVNMYGKANNYQLSFGNLFGYGFKATAIAMLLVIAFTVLIFVAMPDMKEKIFEEARRGMEEQNKLSDSDIEKGMEFMGKFFYVFMVGGILLSYAILGAVGSLIGAAITKKRPYNPLDQLDMKP
jgi:NADH:ubiquinone oxidoreductase subunit 6 (subunit J)